VDERGGEDRQREKEREVGKRGKRDALTLFSYFVCFPFFPFSSPLRLLHLASFVV